MKIFRLIAVMAGFAVIAFAPVSCKKNGVESNPADVDYYTCTMHPSVKSQDPNAKCPLCGMDLVPVKKKPAPAH
jgi:Cu(I)/Ag(I) efflux system membrane fusion protein